MGVYPYGMAAQTRRVDASERPSPLPRTLGLDDVKERWVRRGLDERPLTYLVSGDLPVYLLLERAGASLGDKLLSLSGLYRVAETTVRSVCAGAPCQPHVITGDVERCTNVTSEVVPPGTD